MSVYLLHLCTIFRYDHQNHSVATCTSDVIQEQKETEKQKTEFSEEVKSLKKAVEKLEEELSKNAKNVEEIEVKISVKNTELQNCIKSVYSGSCGMDWLAALVPFIGPLIKYIYDTANATDVAAQTRALEAELTRLTSEKSNLQNKEWTIQLKLTELHLQMANSKIQQGERFSHELELQHLKEYRPCFLQVHQEIRFI